MTAKTTPAFSAASLTYVGGICIPHVKVTDVTPLPNSYPADGCYADALNMGGRPFAIDQARREFVLGTRYGRAIRLAMVEPALHTDGNVNTFPVAPYVEPMAVGLSGPPLLPDPAMTDKSWFEICVPYDTANTGPGGFQPLQNKILISGQTYYDANNSQRFSIAAADWPPVPPASDYHPNRRPFAIVGDTGSQGLVAGYFAPIPEAWQQRLKGNMLMGNSSLPIISRGSAGPCATSFVAEDVLSHDVIATTLLVGYPQGHWMPEHPWDNPNPDEVYNQATMITGMAIVGDTIVFVGSHGYGQSCYGNGTGDPALAGTPSPDGSHYCFDPTSSAKASHCYPYRVQLWHYPLQDLADVAAGLKAPWDLRPQWFELVLPFVQPSMTINGCAFDPQTNRLFVCAYAADGYGYEPGPVIYAYDYIGESVAPPVEGCTDPACLQQIEDLQQHVDQLTKELADEVRAHESTKAQLADATDRLTEIRGEAQTISTHSARIEALATGGPTKT
jgi:hypothetical protein